MENLTMKRADYRCNKCDTLFEYEKENAIDNFPKNPVCTNCNSDDTVRKSWGNIIIPPNMKAVN